ncbi:MAG: MotA/TolQ/ExbB proton channel family protein [Candidatus Aminicenantes bacterium]|nr:MAG: MotA/TolQ/ExbB proton channel family protein [Candidatus Aminicenantes bacterium]
MEISTVIGLVVAVGFIFYGISRDIGMFLDMNSLAIVLGGTIGTIFVRYPIKMIASLFPIIMKTFYVKIDNPDEMIKKIVSLSVEAKKNGILGLEKVKIENAFLRKGVQLAIDGVEPELIEAVLNIDMVSTTRRHETGRGMLVAAGDAAPAFGMMGTLIGLVLMLGDMDDPKGIGPAMALALLTTLYGVFMANVFFLPMADKLKYFHEQEMLIKRLIVNGILSIANGDHPAVVQEKIGSFLNPESRKRLDATMKAGSS